MEFKDILKKLRKEKGLTQEELGKEIGLSAITIRSYEAGRRLPNSEAFVKLETFFNISGSQLSGNDAQKISWEDPDVMNEILESLSFILKSTLIKAQNETDYNKKILLNICIELQDVLNLKNDYSKSMILEIIADNIHSINKNMSQYSQMPKED